MLFVPKAFVYFMADKPIKRSVMTTVDTDKHNYELVQNWGRLPEDWTYGVVSAIATDSQNPRCPCEHSSHLASPHRKQFTRPDRRSIRPQPRHPSKTGCGDSSFRKPSEASHRFRRGFASSEASRSSSVQCGLYAVCAASSLANSAQVLKHRHCTWERLGI